MAALEHFGTRGYADSTIEGICAEAGVGIRAFYDEFRTREELLRQVYDYAAGRAYDAPRCGRVVCIESAALDRTLGPHRLATLKRFATLSISALPPATQARLPNPRLWATLLSGGINAVLTDWLISPVRPEIDELVDDLTELWLGTLPVT
jgi:AcrR family transcriptional regulator